MKTKIFMAILLINSCLTTSIKAMEQDLVIEFQPGLELNQKDSQLVKDCVSIIKEFPVIKLIFIPETQAQAVKIVRKPKKIKIKVGQKKNNAPQRSGDYSEDEFLQKISLCQEDSQLIQYAFRRVAEFPRLKFLVPITYKDEKYRVRVELNSSEASPKASMRKIKTL